MDYERFIRIVPRAATIRQQEARRATRATLETLAHGEAEHMTLLELVERVVDREGMTDEQAQNHIRAVFVTLREGVGDDEFFDVVVELPEEYVSAVA